MEIIKIKFGDLWNGFDKKDNFFTKVLSQKFKVEISDDPDFYFFSHPYNGKREYLKYNCHRIFLGWENERADWNMCDYVLDSDFVAHKPNHKRFPLWASWNTKILTNAKSKTGYLNKKKFCCMLVSNPHAKERIEFFKLLSKSKKVDSGGKFLNNIGYNVADKMEFIRDYKFVISFENSSYPGYTTEKLIEPMFTDTIPIYWGNPQVGIDFNTKSFVNVNDFPSFDDAIKYIIELDSDDIKYHKVAMEPWFKNNLVHEELRHESLIDFFDYILDDSKSRTPVAKSIFKRQKHNLRLLSVKLTWIVYKLLGIQKGFR